MSNPSPGEKDYWESNYCIFFYAKEKKSHPSGILWFGKTQRMRRNSISKIFTVEGLRHALFVLVQTNSAMYKRLAVV